MNFFYNLPEEKHNLLELKISDEKYFTLIYGHNGVGKSSFANSIHKNSENSEYNSKNNETLLNWKTYLFNRKYIYENVYITSEKGFASNSRHNQHWGDIFLGSNINLKTIEIAKINSMKAKLRFDFNNINYKDLIHYLNNEFSEEELIKAFSTYINDFNENNFIKHYKYTKSDNSFLYTDDDLSKISFICEHKFNFQDKELQEELLKSIDKPQLSLVNNVIQIYNSKLIIQINLLNVIINTYNENLKDLDVLKKSVDILKTRFGKDFEYNNVLSDWIRTGIDLHKGKTCCLFCSNSDLTLIESHETILNNKIQISKKDIINKIKEINNIITEIKLIEKNINKKSLILEIASILKKIEEYFYLVKNELETQIKINKFSINLTNIKIIDVKEKKSKVLLDFLLMKNSYYQSEIKKILYKKILEEKEKEVNQEIEIIIKNTINDVYKIINDSKLFLGIDSEVSISIQKAPGSVDIKQRQLIFKKDKKHIINSVSEGQRFKFALLIFINEITRIIKNDNNKNNLIIFDDPIDSADMFTYFSFKSILINFVKKMNKIGKNIKVIILTHNIDYAMVQFNTAEKFLENMEFIKMQINKSVAITYKEMFTNDKLMFLQLHELLIKTCNQDLQSKKYILNKKILLFYLCLVRKYLESFLEEIYVFNLKNNLDILETNINNKILKEIKEKIKDSQIILLCENIKDIISNTLNNKWLKNEMLTKEELDSIFQLVLLVNKYNLIEVSEFEKNIFSDYVFPKDIKISDLKEIEKDESLKKYFLASKLLAQKNNNSGSIFEFIKTFLRHSNSNFVKPFIAFDEKILNDIINSTNK